MSTLQERYDAIQRYLEGEPLLRLAKVYKMSSRTIKAYVRRYQKYGMQGLADKRVSHYSQSTKLSVINDYETNGLSLKTVSEKYDITKKTFLHWLDEYERYKKGDKWAMNGNGRIYKDTPNDYVFKMPDIPKKKEIEESLRNLTYEQLLEKCEDLMLELEIKKKVEKEIKRQQAALRRSLRKPSKK